MQPRSDRTQDSFLDPVVFIIIVFHFFTCKMKNISSRIFVRKKTAYVKYIYKTHCQCLILPNSSYFVFVLSCAIYWFSWSNISIIGLRVSPKHHLYLRLFSKLQISVHLFLPKFASYICSLLFIHLACLYISSCYYVFRPEDKTYLFPVVLGVCVNLSHFLFTCSSSLLSRRSSSLLASPTSWSPFSTCSTKGSRICAVPLIPGTW